MSDDKLLKDLVTLKLLNKYSIQQIPKESFYSLFEEKFSRYFEKMIYFNHDALFNDYVNNENILPYQFQISSLFLVIHDNHIPIALFKGRPISSNAYSMDLSVVQAEYRRKGIYTALMDIILNYTKIAGFSVVCSTHSPINNDILIAKMKKGFTLTAMNISPEFGPEVTLSYFHNPSYKKAFLFRCGKIELDQELVKNSRGTLHAFNALLNEHIK